MFDKIYEALLNFRYWVARSFTPAELLMTIFLAVLVVVSITLSVIEIVEAVK